MSRDPGFFLITDTTLITIQGSRAKGQSVMGESGESSKGQTPSLQETRASRVTFEKPPDEMTKHLRPLYIRAHIDGKPVSRVLVDNGAAVNIQQLRMVRRLSKSEQDFLPSEVSVTSFDGGVAQTKGIIPVDLTVGNTTKVSAFFVVDGTVAYNALLGRDWIHSNWCIPSSLHQFLVFWNDKNEIEIVLADNRPFTVNANLAEAQLYHRNVGPLRLLQPDGEGRPTRASPIIDEVDTPTLETVLEMYRPSVI